MKSWPLLLVAIFVATSNATPILQSLREEDIDYGCGCSFYVPRNKGPKGSMVLMWEAGSDAKVRINGKLHKLSVHEPPTMSEWPGRVGEQIVYTLTGEGISATAKCTTTHICPPDQESCETTIYKARIAVKTKDGTNMVSAWAACGC